MFMVIRKILYRSYLAPRGLDLRPGLATSSQRDSEELTGFTCSLVGYVESLILYYVKPGKACFFIPKRMTPTK